VMLRVLQGNGMILNDIVFYVIEYGRFSLEMGQPI
jgi:hypothetical protein